MCKKDERVYRRKNEHGELGSLPLRSPEVLGAIAARLPLSSSTSKRTETVWFQSKKRNNLTQSAVLISILIFICWCGWQTANTDHADKAPLPSASADPLSEGSRQEKVDVALATWTAKDIEKKRRMAAKSSGLDPKDEQSFDVSELKSYFGCRKLFEKPREDITEDHWMYFRDLYKEYVAKQMPKTYKAARRSDHVNPVDQAVTPGKGRGLVASRDIKRGELIFTGTNNTIAFETGDAWRNFLLHLYYSAPPPTGGYEDGFACDIRSW